MIMYDIIFDFVNENPYSSNDEVINDIENKNNIKQFCEEIMDIVSMLYNGMESFKNHFTEELIKLKKLDKPQEIYTDENDPKVIDVQELKNRVKNLEKENTKFKEELFAKNQIINKLNIGSHKRIPENNEADICPSNEESQSSLN